MRVDDFPRVDLKDFKRFDSVIEKYHIPYLLGVTPHLCLDPLNPKSTKFRKLSKEEIKTLHSLKDVELAMHGVTHQTREYGPLKRLWGFRSEFVGLDETALINKIQKGFSLFRKYGLKRPRVLIPPFNTFDYASLGIIESYYDVVCGGPESGKKFGREWKRFGKLLYIPSLPPHYDHAEKIKIPESGKVCITIHLGWEIGDGFRALEGLSKKLEGKVASWSELR